MSVRNNVIFNRHGRDNISKRHRLAQVPSQSRYCLGPLSPIFLPRRLAFFAAFFFFFAAIIVHLPPVTDHESARTDFAVQANLRRGAESYMAKSVTWLQRTAVAAPLSILPIATL
jgi:hypothetical protein